MNLNIEAHLEMKFRDSRDKYLKFKRELSVWICATESLINTLMVDGVPR